MKKLYLLFMSVTLIFFTNYGCHTYVSEDCYETKPSKGEAMIEITMDEENQKIPFELYEGKYEAGKLVISDTLYSKIHYIELPVNKYYTFLAKYSKDSEDLYVFRSGTIKARRNANEDYSCWNTINIRIDLKLK